MVTYRAYVESAQALNETLELKEAALAGFILDWKTLDQSIASRRLHDEFFEELILDADRLYRLTPKRKHTLHHFKTMN